MTYLYLARSGVLPSTVDVENEGEIIYCLKDGETLSDIEGFDFLFLIMYKSDSRTSSKSMEDLFIEEWLKLTGVELYLEFLTSEPKEMIKSLRKLVGSIESDTLSYKSPFIAFATSSKMAFEEASSLIRRSYLK